MKHIITILFLLLVFLDGKGQFPKEFLKQIKDSLSRVETDTGRLDMLFEIANGYRFSDIDSSLHYSDLAIQLADKLNSERQKIRLLSLKGATLLESGKIPESLQYQFEALTIGQRIKDTNVIAFALNRIGNIYMELADYRKANEYYFRSMDLFGLIRDSGMYYNEISNIGNVYELMQMPDSALYFQLLVYNATFFIDDRTAITRPEVMFRLGNAYRQKGNRQKALESYKSGLVEAIKDNDIRNLAMNNLFLAKLYQEMNKPDSSLKYAYAAIRFGEHIYFRKGVHDASMLISALFRNRGQYDSAFKYLERATGEKDSLTGIDKFQEMQRIVLSEQERQRETEAKAVAARNRQRQYALLGGLAIFLVIAAILYRNNKQKQKANKVLDAALSDLKATQTQLVHSEKMASLGELTAGIAHEIQNPLNFVNNFAELNAELILEMKEELSKGNFNEASELADTIAENDEKIRFHGKRADGIVKGMLQHSRKSTGQKESIKINQLADEYLRLAYHGLRARDKTFNATLKTDFDESVGSIHAVPQDIGRVILNLITNAFYAVAEKKKHAKEAFEPTVSVSTHSSNGLIEIRIKDNGNGIPPTILDKIFQPFFTTKPTGEGTGLGLSMSYDIITKGHNGELIVNTVEGDGSEFIIKLPPKGKT